MYSHYLIGTLVIFLTALVASKPKLLGWSDDVYTLLSLAATLFAGVLTIVKPHDLAARFRRAWVMVSVETAQFIDDPSYPLKPVLDAFTRGEEIIRVGFTSAVPEPESSTFRR